MVTDPKVAAALRECEEACPCRVRHGRDTEGLCGVIACWCYSLKIDRTKMAFGWPGPQERRPECAWSGHAAIARLREAAEKSGREYAWREAREELAKTGAAIEERLAAAEKAGYERGVREMYR